MLIGKSFTSTPLSTRIVLELDAIRLDSRLSVAGLWNGLECPRGKPRKAVWRMGHSDLGC